MKLIPIFFLNLIFWINFLQSQSIHLKNEKLLNVKANPDAGPDDQICGTSYELKGKASNPNNKIIWCELAQKGVHFFDQSEPNTYVDVFGGYGMYQFMIKETDSNGIVSTDIVEITFNENPRLENTEKHCDLHSSTSHTYRVISDIRGGIPPYEVLIPPSTPNGRIVENQWWSDTLNSLDVFTIVVKDSKNCISLLIQDDHNCDCGLVGCEYTIPSLLDEKSKIACSNDCIEIDIIKKGKADTSKHAVNYILHSSKTQFDSPKDVFSILDSKQEICFNPNTITLNKIFFITEVSGMDRNPKDGYVDFMDPCTINYSNSMRVTFVQKMKVDAGLDQKICGLNHKLNGQPNVDGASWRQLSGPVTSFSSHSISNPDVILTSPGQAVFVYSIQSNGCITEDTVQLEFKNSLSSSHLSYLCRTNNNKNEYYFFVTISNGLLPYKVIQGNGSIDSFGLYKSEFIPDDSEEIVTIEDANGCSISIKVKHECRCTNDVGIMDPNLRTLCQDQCVDIRADNLYDDINEKLDVFPRDTLIFFVCTNSLDPLNSSLFNLKTSVICYDARYSFGTTYYIGAKVGRANGRGDIDPIQGCVRVDAGTPIVFYPNPKPTAGADLDVCGSTIILKTENSVDFSTLQWRELDSNNLGISKIAENSHKIHVKKNFACYKLILEEVVNNGLCVAEDTIQICFKPAIEIYNVKRVARWPDTNSIVTVRFRGGSGRIQVDTSVSTKGNIINDQFISDSIGSSEVFKLRLVDSLLCDTILILDGFICGNVSAGTLDTSALIICENNCATVKELQPEVVFGNDVINYIVHKSTFNSPLPGLVLDTFFNLNEHICFDPKTMKYLEPLLVTRVVGEDINPKDGIVDATDPCRRASNNFKIIFEGDQFVHAGEDAEVCGLVYQLTGSFVPAEVKWKQISGVGNAIFNNISDPTSFVTVDLPGVYCFELNSRSSCGINSDKVCIHFYDAPEFIRPSAKIICHESKNQYKLNVEVRNGDPKTRAIKAFNSISKKRIEGNFNSSRQIWESDWLNNNQNITLQLKDTNDCNVDILRLRSSCIVKNKPDTSTTDTAKIVGFQLEENIIDNEVTSNGSNLLDQNVTQVTHVEIINLNCQRVFIVNKELDREQFAELIEYLKANLTQGLYVIYLEYKLTQLQALQTTRKLVYLK